MKEKVVELVSFILVVMLFILMFVSSIRITYATFSLYIYSNHLIFIGILGLLIYIVSKIKNFKFSKYEIIIFILMILSSLSLINAIDINTALFGMVDRNEGLFVILTYYILALVSMNIKSKRYIKFLIILILTIGLSNLFYGLLQVGILKISDINVRNSWSYARGFVGNHMFFGTLMSICYPLTLGIYLKCNDIIKKTISYILVLIFSLGVVISGSMSIFVSVIFTFLLVIFDSIINIKKKKKNFLEQILLIVFSIVSFCCITFIISNKENMLKNDITELISQTNSISNGEIKEEFGTGRIYIWKNTIEKIKENYLFGVGIDNFRNAFQVPLLDPTGLIVTKAHNDYLQKMLCEGIFSGLLFIIFLLIIFFKNLFRDKNSIYYAIFLAFVSYSIQAFFSISITRVAPFYFVLIGLLISFENQNKIRKAKKEKCIKNKSLYFFLKRLFDIFISIFGCILLIPISLIIKIIYILNKDYDSIIFKQERIGKDGKVFKMYKYRTMVIDADLKLKDLLKEKKYLFEWNKKQKLENDPRITKIGRKLRNSCLDELPQFINVLKGEMSFIGPRPLILNELESHKGNKEIYQSIKPGITGNYVSNYTSKITYKKRLEMEYFYINNCSLLFDLKIILKTFLLIINKGGSK